MTLIEFQTTFGTEEQCRQYLFEKRWSEGFICPKCNHNEYYNIICRNRYQCKACNYQASVTAGTLMDKTRTPLVKWFMAMHLMSSDKRGISALTLKSQLKISYNTAWTMCQKIRRAMGKRNDDYVLSGIIEFDDAFFGGSSEGGKRGRGTEKTAVLVSVSLNDKGKPKNAKIDVIENVDGETIVEFAKDNIQPGSEIRTDGFPVYSPLKEEGYSLVMKKFDPKKDPNHLHWTHIIISNAKAFITGTFHGLDKIHLQYYLDEFCFRFNRRFKPESIFNSLLNASVCFGIIRNYELTR